MGRGSCVNLQRADNESANLELAAKLNSEIALEKDNQDDAFRESVTEYLENSDYQIEDIDGQDQVYLTRTFGDEQCVRPPNSLLCPTLTSRV